MMDKCIVISGIGRHVDLDEVQLLLESTRFCPDGGEVADIQRISENSALVTFDDSQSIYHERI